MTSDTSGAGTGPAPRPSDQQPPTGDPTSPARPSSRLRVRGPSGDRHGEILTDEALDFVAGLQRRFAGRRDELLQRRRDLRSERPDFGFPAETAAIRADTCLSRSRSGGSKGSIVKR